MTSLLPLPYDILAQKTARTKPDNEKFNFESLSCENLDKPLRKTSAYRGQFLGVLVELVKTSRNLLDRAGLVNYRPIVHRPIYVGLVRVTVRVPKDDVHP